MNRRDIFKSIAGAALVPITKPEIIRKPAMIYGVVIDESGSMSPQRQATIDGFNTHIAELRANSPANLDTRLFVVIFQSVVERAALNIPLSAMPPMKEKDYLPAGMTALYDAVGYTASEMERLGGENTSYVLTIITDGCENSSKEWTGKTLAARLKSLQESGKWTISYIGADNLDLSKERAQFTAFAANAMSYQNTDQGVRSAYARHTEALRGFAVQRSVNLGNLSTSRLYADPGSTSKK